MKTLIYCTKAKPYLALDLNIKDINGENVESEKYYLYDKKTSLIYKRFLNNVPPVNGKVIASFELNRWEEMSYDQQRKEYTSWLTNEYFGDDPDWYSGSCLTADELKAYGKGKDLYAWYIDNLKIFDEPVELSELYKDYEVLSIKDGKEIYTNDTPYFKVTKAPQSYQYVYYKGEKCILLPIKSQHLYNILQGKKTIEIRKSVPKEVR